MIQFSLKATGRNLAIIATIIINRDNDMTGILYGLIDFNNYNRLLLQSLNLQKNTRLFDNHSQIWRKDW